MYLYIFESGDCRQLIVPPTDADKEAVKDGILSIFCVESGDFQEMRRDLKWRPVPKWFSEPQAQ